MLRGLVRLDYGCMECWMRVGGGDELKLKILCITDTVYKSNVPQNHNFCKRFITINLISVY